MNQISNFGEATLASLAASMAVFFTAIPRILGFLAILIIGWIIASLVSKAIAALLRSVNFEGLAQRSGITAFVNNMGVETDASGFIALIAKWFIRIIALVVAFDALGLPAVSQVLQSFLLWIPNLVVGVVVLVIGGLLANAAQGLIRGSAQQAGLGNPDMLATITKLAVWAFTIVIAVNQIGVASTLVNTLLMGVVFATALALGLAFGIGGQDTAREIVKNWHNQARNVDPQKISNAAEAAKARVERFETSTGAASRRG
jgi:hypothetical protein